MRSRAAIPHHPVEVFEYAIKHGYPDLIEEAGQGALSARPFRALMWAQKGGLTELVDRAAGEALASSLQHAYQNLSPEMFGIWV